MYINEAIVIHRVDRFCKKVFFKWGGDHQIATTLNRGDHEFQYPHNGGITK